MLLLVGSTLGKLTHIEVGGADYYSVTKSLYSILISLPPPLSPLPPPLSSSFPARGANQVVPPGLVPGVLPLNWTMDWNTGMDSGMDYGLSGIHALQVFVREEEDERSTKATIDHGGRRRSAMCWLYGTVGRRGGGGGALNSSTYACLLL